MLPWFACGLAFLPARARLLVRWGRRITGWRFLSFALRRERYLVGGFFFWFAALLLEPFLRSVFRVPGQRINKTKGAYTNVVHNTPWE